MHQELIRELAMITDEERRILEGKQEIDPQLYTEKKEMVVDSAKLLKKGPYYSMAKRAVISYRNLITRYCSVAAVPILTLLCA